VVAKPEVNPYPDWYAYVAVVAKPDEPEVIAYPD